MTKLIAAMGSLLRKMLSNIVTTLAIIGVLIFGSRLMTATAEAAGWNLGGLKAQESDVSLVGRRGRWRGRGWGRRWWRGRRGRWWRGRRGRRGWWWRGPVIIIR